MHVTKSQNCNNYNYVSFSNLQGTLNTYLIVLTIFPLGEFYHPYLPIFWISEKENEIQKI